MRVWSASFVAFATVALVCLFALPLLVPMHPALSLSYQFGYHNRAALLICLLALAVCAFAVREPAMDVPTGDASMSRRYLALGMLATTILCGIAFLIAWPMHGIDEAPYLITRLRLVIAGQRPYQDFEFLYGPALLYIPYAFVRLIGVSAFAAYSLAWFLMWLAGTAMQFYVVRNLRFPRERQAIAFWLMWAVFAPFILNYGATYTPLRQLGVLAAMLLFQKVFDRGHYLQAAAATLVCVGGLYLLSPELPIALAFATAFYSVTSGLFGRAANNRRMAMICAATIAAGAAFETWMAMHLHEFDSAKEFGGGGADLPPQFAPATLCMLAALATAAIFCGLRIRKRRVDGPAIAACIAAFTLLPGAFGRSDPLHYWIYLLGAVFVALLIVSTRPKVWRVAVVLFVLFAPLHLLISKLMVNRLILLQSATMYLFPNGNMHPDGFRGKIAAKIPASAAKKLAVRAQTAPANPAEVFSSESQIMQAPFGYAIRGAASVLEPNAQLGYFDGMNDIMGTKQVERKINEIAAHPERDLLLPKGFRVEASCRLDPNGARNLMKALYGFTYYRSRHVAYLTQPLCDYIGAHYRFAEAPATDAALVELWKRKE